MKQIRLPRLPAWRWRREPWLRLPLIGFAPLFVLYLCQLITLQSGPAALAWMDGHTQALFFTYGVLFLVQLLMLLLTRRLFPATLLITVPTVLFAVANHLKEVLNGAPILASDLAMTGQAGEIAGFLRPGMELGSATVPALLLALLLLFLAFLFSKGTPRQAGHGRQLLSAALVLSLLGNTVWAPGPQALLNGPENESQGARNERLGLLAGIYSALRESAMEEPDAYSENNMNRILRQLQSVQEPAGQEERPNVVLILSESFFDVTRLPGIDFAEDPLPHFRALQAQSGGRFLSAAYAGGTGNVEMELLTGIPSAFPGASESLTTLSDRSAYRRMPSLVKALEGQGYDTMMVHSYNDSLYNRAYNLPALGFDHLLYDRDFTVEPRYEGGYLSDDTLADQLIAAFEEKGDSPLFLYGLTMENHQPYYDGKFSSPSGVEYSCPSLTGSGLGALDSLIHGIRDADAMLGKLVDYFETCGEPVLLVFLGDHLPGLYLDGADTIYSRLGYASSPNTEDWSADELMQMHQTDYLVWNNYGAQLEAPPLVSVTGLAAQLLDWAGLWKPLWFTWVEETQSDMLLYRERLFVDGSGTPHDSPTQESEETVSIYRSLVYDILYGEHYISQELTDYIPGTD